MKIFDSMKMKRLYVLMVFLFAVACVKSPEFPPVCGVGFPDGDVSCTYQEGVISARVLSSGEFSATIEDDALWLRFADDPASRTISAYGDVDLKFVYDINRGVPRTAKVTLVCGNNQAVLTVSQDGLLDNGFELKVTSMAASYEGGSQSVLVYTKLKELEFDVEYLEDDRGWVNGLLLQNNFLCFELNPNWTDAIRHAVITINYSGGSSSLRLTQYCEGVASEEISVEDLKKRQPGVIEDHVILKGKVINDWSENNGGEIKTVSIDSPDPSWQERVVYIQNTDGTEGVKLVFQEGCKSTINRFNEIGVDLFGLELKHEANPERYSISDIPLHAIVNSVEGERVEPRGKTIAALTDSDLYTYVKLEDVEIPVRKGCYMPMDIRYIGSIMTYPMVIHDVYGDRSYMMVNANCPWSRDGKELPHGKGAIAGVLVYEYCDNFEWDSNKERQLGNSGLMSEYISGIGDLKCYQIRPVTKDDVCLAKEVKDSFSEILCEWAYCDSLGVNLTKNYDTKSNVLYPTYTTMQDTTGLNARFYCAEANEKVAIGLCNDFTHLGPYVYGKTITQPENGNGIYDSQGRSAHHWYNATSVSTIGVIYSDETDPTRTNGSAWQVSGWSVNRYWCAEFSTLGVNSPMTVQLGTMGCIKGYGAPRYWVMEYSIDGSAWNSIGSYTVPDFTYAVPRRFFQLPGTKYLSFSLPDELCGKERVYVRMRPENTLCGDASSYDGGRTISASRYNAINYFAIRYKK